MNEFSSFAEEFDKFKELFKQAAEIFTPNVCIGIAVTVILFILEIKWIRKRSGREKHNKRVDKAIAMGHVVKAKKIKAYEDPHYVKREGNNQYWHAVYLYEVDGKEYKYRYMELSAPPWNITLYYLNNPKRAFTFRDKNKWKGIFEILYTIIPLFSGAIVVILLGGV